MKRIISLLLIFAAVFSLAACSGKDGDETTVALPPEIMETVHSKDFKDESGKTVIKVKVTLPQITKNCDEKVKNYINKIALDIYNNACDFGESNIENASSFMKSMKSEKPWAKTVTFETTRLSNRYACFIMKDSLSYFDSEVKPVWSTFCVDVKTGAECSLQDFATAPDDAEGCFKDFLNDVVAPVLPMKFTNPSYINDEVLARLDEIVSPDCFYLNEKGLGVYFDKRLVHENLNGTFKISFTWDEIAAYYEMPDEG